jgi:uracil phosphoribosyltransferase
MYSVDSQFTALRFHPSEIPHGYGDRFHILADPFCLTLLARLCQPATVQPQAGHLVRQLYEFLLHAVVCSEFPRRPVTIETRMKAQDPAGVWRGEVVDTSARVSVIALARAGLQPSQVCFESFCEFMDVGVVRQDHLAAQRATDAHGGVTGTVIAASKIGGTLNDHLVVVPDPMGATGSTVLALTDHFRLRHLGTPRKLIFMHLMVTPEYLRRVKETAPSALVYALRLDRGLSSPEVLAARPGDRWDEERGLTDKGYIVPGAGGVGELLNNSWV